MSIRRTGNPTLVYNAAALAEMAAHISQRRLWALDTESDSLYSYYPKICLIQISVPDPIQESAQSGTSGSAREAELRVANTRNVTDYLLDPLRYNDLGPLGDVLSDPANEVIMHAAANDISLLQREYGFTIRRVFDTQLAARILGWKQVGLAAILEEYFGVVSNKRMQRTNWGKRPLTPEQIAYAQMDTHYLPALRAIQIEQLKEADRWEEAQEAFEMLANSNYAERPMNDRTFWQMKESRSVPREATGVLEALWEWREAEAKRRDVPSFKVMNNRALAQLAIEQPVNQRGLERIVGLGEGNVQRFGAALLAAIAEGKRRPLPDLPQPHLRPEQTLDRSELALFDALREWRGRTAEARGVAPDIVFSNDILLEIVRRSPRTPEELTQIPEIGPWKARTYGPAIIQIISKKE